METLTVGETMEERQETCPECYGGLEKVGEAALSINDINTQSLMTFNSIVECDILECLECKSRFHELPNGELGEGDLNADIN